MLRQQESKTNPKTLFNIQFKEFGIILFHDNYQSDLKINEMEHSTYLFIRICLIW